MLETVECFKVEGVTGSSALLACEDFRDKSVLKDELKLPRVVRGSLHSMLIEYDQQKKPTPSSSPQPLSVPAASLYTVLDYPITLQPMTSQQIASGVLFGSFVDPLYKKNIYVVLKVSKGTNEVGVGYRDLEQENAILNELKKRNVQNVVHLFDFNSTASPQYLVLKACGTSLDRFMKPNIYQYAKKLP